jgi:hypothetical protein
MVKALPLTASVLATFVLILGLAFLGGSCASKDDPVSSSSTSSGSHTVNKKGVMHMSGLTSPLSYCVSCHGSDLTGGSAGVSCYRCHGKVW